MSGTSGGWPSSHRALLDGHPLCLPVGPAPEERKAASWITGCSLSPEQFPLPTHTGYLFSTFVFQVPKGPTSFTRLIGSRAMPPSTIGTVPCLVTQSCPTLCDSMDCSPPGSSVHGDSPGKNTEVGCHALLQGTFSTQGSNPGLLHCMPVLS